MRTVATETELVTGEQRPFWLKHEADSLRTYGFGVEMTVGALVFWLDPDTRQNHFSGFLSAGHALLQMQRQFGPTTPLVVVWDERPSEDDTPLFEEELIIMKARAAQRIRDPVAMLASVWRIELLWTRIEALR